MRNTKVAGKKFERRFKTIGSRILATALAFALVIGFAPMLPQQQAEAAADTHVMTWPLPGYYTISGCYYGYNDGSGSNHHSIDIPTYKTYGKSVVAAYGGKVLTAIDNGKYNQGMGNYVVIEHKINGRKLYTRYCHLDNKSIVVKQGWEVKAGQKLGCAGTTGESTGVHLDFSLATNPNSFGATKIDPSIYFKNIGHKVTPTSSNAAKCCKQTCDRLNQSKETVETPTIKKKSDVINGINIAVSTSTKDATIHYTTNGKDPSKNDSKPSTMKSGSTFFDGEKKLTVRAYATKSNYNSSAEAKQQTFTLSQLKPPTVKVTNTANGAAVTIDAEKGSTIYYTEDGSTPSMTNGKVYKQSLIYTENKTITAMCVKKGAISSKASPATPVTVTAPAAPEVRLSADKVAAGEAVQVSWNADSAAQSYTATLYKDNQEVDFATIEGTTTSFILPDVSAYAVSVTATNAIGTSAASEARTVNAVGPSTVQFVDTVTDENGETSTVVVNEQLVPYGHSAVRPPAPKKKGYTFAGWSGSYSNVTQDMQIAAEWDINSYSVEFYAKDGVTSLGRQTITYGQSASAPNPGTPDTGYVFSGWSVMQADDDSDRDYTKVDSNMKLRAVFAWGDEELPVVASINSATRKADGTYTVSVDLTNTPANATTALLRVALKTSAGKLVQTSRETVSIEADGTTSKTVELKYAGNYVANVAEVEVVGIDGNYRTGGAYSKAVTASVIQTDTFKYTDWSGWSTTKPVSSSDVDIEEMTQYRYADKQTTTSTSTSLSGWTRDGTSNTSYGSWSAAKTSTSNPGSSDTVSITSTKKTYNYYHYCNKYTSSSSWCQDSCASGYKSVKHTKSSTTLHPTISGFSDKGGKGSSARRASNPTSFVCSYGYTTWWLGSTTTTYTYKTRSKTVTYGYYKWGDWSDWSDTEVKPTDNRKVETRTVYRYRTKDYSEVNTNEDMSGTVQNISGKLNVSDNLAGKEATIMVYNVSNTDPNEDQMQYIGQTTIGSGNTYSFSFIPRSDPSAQSGDYIVSLGVKGSTGLVNVAMIKAPKPEYKVTYQYAKEDGSVTTIATETVAAGGTAKLPIAPDRSGYRFTGWSSSVENINGDMVVNALYSPNTYTVVWVDWANEDVLMETHEYGDELNAPQIDEDDGVEGQIFKGWDALLNGKTTIEGNMVINAVYEPVTYTVSFVDADNKVVEEQQVAFGKSAKLPSKEPTASGRVFLGWDTSGDSTWWDVRGDMIVGSIFGYENSTDSPYMIVDSELEEGYVGVEGMQVFLESSTESAKIYYTLDGSDPAFITGEEGDRGQESSSRSVMALASVSSARSTLAASTYEYDADAGIVLTQPCTIKAMAMSANANDSCIVEIPVNYTATNNLANAEIYCDDYYGYESGAANANVIVLIGDSVLEEGKDFTVSYKNNTGIGTATAVVTGTGSYTGSNSTTFEISDKYIEAVPDDGEESSDGNQTTDNPPVDNPSIDNPPADNPPADNSPTDNAAVNATWVSSDGNWYLMSDKGEKLTGMQTVSGVTYYMHPSGAMATGWIQHSNKWYYFDSTGAMVTGWVKDGGKWYRFDSSGHMLTGWQKSGKKWYYHGTKSDGAMKTGWVKVGKKWYYMGGKSDGAMKTGWVKVGKSWYYMGGKSDGAMKTGWQKVGKKWYYLKKSGAMASKEWVGSYYLQSDGTMATGCWVDGGRYYVDANGAWVPGA